MKDELESGSSLGKYELLVRIGRGGMASVWVARERGRLAQRLVAVKAMLPELAQSSDFRSMFLEEGGIVRSIDHANVVRVYEVAEDRGILYMAMEWVEGDSLRTLIREAQKRRAVPPEIGVRIVADAAAGLHAAHELRGWDGELRGIVHCDVSPHNILVGLNGAPKLVDFGVARAVTYGALEGGGMIRGKFAYMSPEQAQARPIDRRSDVFSLGIVLFELLTGYRLFKGRDKQHALELVSFGKIPRPSELNPRLAPGLEEIVLKALDRDPEGRYQTAKQLKEALERWLVQQRVLVSQAGVGQLLRRVLGGVVEQRRDAIREALVLADGKLGMGLISDQPILEGMPSESDHESVSVSVASVSTHSATGSDPWRTRPSGVPASSPSVSATPRPQTLSRRRGSRSSMLFVIGALVGVAAGAGGVLWAINNSPTAQAGGSEGVRNTHEMTPGAQTAPPVASVDQSGLSVDSLPLDEEERKRVIEERERQRTERRTKDDDDKRRRDEEERRKKEEDERKRKAESVDLAEEPEPKAPEPESVSLAEEAKPAAKPKPEEPMPSGPLPPLNRGAAIAALGSAASAASGCTKEGGPSGRGNATVTFAPNGSVSNVSVSGKFAGTSVGSCVQAAFRRARLSPFSGGPVTLSRSFEVPE
jgi:serine/threonine protein kinase